MTEARELFDYQKQATEAKRGRRLPSHLRLADETATARPAEKTGPKWTRDAARLDLLGWEHRVRLGKRIWSHEEVDGGAFYSEDMAVRINDERKGS